MLSVLDWATEVRRRRCAADFDRQQSHFVVDPLLNGQPVYLASKTRVPAIAASQQNCNICQQEQEEKEERELQMRLCFCCELNDEEIIVCSLSPVSVSFSV